MDDNHYGLACVDCGRIYQDAENGFLLTCEENHGPSLLRSVFREKELRVQDANPGIFRFHSWLPVRRILAKAQSPVVYQSEQLASRLGMERLFIAFSGYWPERGVRMETGSFKELEAYPVCARVPEGEQRDMVVASAGNTGRAFLQVASAAGVAVTVVVPEFALGKMWITEKKHPKVKLAVLKGEVDYLDAILLSQLLVGLEDFYAEGGAQNIARRDGMGTVVLTAAETIGELPAHYFQAVGSGTGGIAAWEMSQRLIDDGGYGSRRMKLHLVQNQPFTIMTDAWQASSREVPPISEKSARRRIRRIRASVLSNRKPPYGITGGVFDALTDTGGYMYAVSNREARKVGRLFEKLEGCDLDPAAEVCLAGLLQALDRGRIKRDELVLLNITGGGEKKLAAENRRYLVQPDITFTLGHDTQEKVAARLRESMGRRKQGVLQC